MKTRVLSHQLFDLKHNEVEHTECIRVHDLIPGWGERPTCLQGKSNEDVVGQLLYGSTRSVTFLTTKELLVGDLVMLPQDSREYLVNRVFISPASNVELYDISADCDSTEPRGARFSDPAVADWHANRKLKELLLTEVPLLNPSETD